jgi:hypothetical protein
MFKFSLLTFLKKEAIMKLIQCFVIASTLSADAVFATTTLSVQEAEKKGLIKLAIRGKGGYTGKVIEMKIQNMSNSSLCLNLEAGRKLDSKDDTQQDILVTKPENFILAAKQQSTYNVYGMCCQAHNSSPEGKSVYSMGTMGDSSLIKLANFIDKNKYYDNHGAQEAVWTVSDNNSIASIQSGKDEDLKKLRQYVSDITGRPIPAYNVIYKQQDERSVIGRVVKVDGAFTYTLNIDNKVTIAIFDSEGKMVQLLLEQYPHARGEYKLFYTFNTAKLPAGSYYARMSMDGAVIKEDKIEF